MSFEPPFSTFKSNKYSCANSMNVCSCGKMQTLPGRILLADMCAILWVRRPKEGWGDVGKGKFQPEPVREGTRSTGGNSWATEREVSDSWQEGRKRLKALQLELQGTQAEKARNTALSFLSIFMSFSLFSPFATFFFFWWEHGLWTHCQGMNLSHELVLWFW